MAYRVYVVEDDESIRGLYEIAFQGKFDCTSFVRAEDMFEALRINRLPDIIILDLMLPGIDGLRALSILKQVPKTRDIPVIIASAKGDESIKVKGLDAGANDYISKPFGMLELIARVKANLRKVGSRKNDDIIECGQITINNSEHVVYVNEQVVNLTLKEYNLLAMLIDNANCVVTRESILSEVWDYEFVGETRTLDMHIKSLRSKLAEYSDKQFILTIRGVGYKLVK